MAFFKRRSSSLGPVGQSPTAVPSPPPGVYKRKITSESDRMTEALFRGYRPSPFLYFRIRSSLGLSMLSMQKGLLARDTGAVRPPHARNSCTSFFLTRLPATMTNSKNGSDESSLASILKPPTNPQTPLAPSWVLFCSVLFCSVLFAVYGSFRGWARCVFSIFFSSSSFIIRIRRYTVPHLLLYLFLLLRVVSFFVVRPSHTCSKHNAAPEVSPRNKI